MTTALVTGANKGIGFEIVKQLIAEGVDVYLGARDVERGEKAAADAGARFVQLDVTDPESVRRAAASLGRLDVLVNNAGITGGSWGPENIREVFETNVFGVITVTDALLPLLRQSAHGRIVNVSSSVGSLAGMIDSPAPPSFSYTPSKTALNAVTVLDQGQRRLSRLLRHRSQQPRRFPHAGPGCAHRRDDGDPGRRRPDRRLLRRRGRRGLVKPHRGVLR
jgi:NAD(P)-dependent dehydrogenase (short-subunit alcohol dehydrogenase family)